MSPELKNAIITFVRGAVAFGVSYAVEAVRGVDPFHTTATGFAEVAIMAFVTGIILFCGQYLRNVTTQPVAPTVTAGGMLKRPAGEHLNRTRSWADWLPI